MCAVRFNDQHSRTRSSIHSKSTHPTFTGERLKCQCCCSAGVSVSLESPGNMGGMRVDKECLMNETVVLSLSCARRNKTRGKVQIMSIISSHVFNCSLILENEACVLIRTVFNKNV